MTCRVRIVTTVIGSVLASGCLPEDTRPDPAKVLADVALPADLAVSQPDPDQPDLRLIEFESDGWTVRVERLYASLGEVEVLADKECSEYADAPYFRILDLAQDGPQRLGQVWGFGSCKIDYTVEVPPVDAVIGAGVTEADSTFMRTARVPVSTPDGPATANGMAVWLRGSATKADVTVTFDWGFAERLQWTECRRSLDNEPEPGVRLHSGETVTVNIVVDPRKLFQLDDMPLVQLVAYADQQQGNADGVVSVSELTRVDVRQSAHNLAEVLRQTGYPAMFVYENGDFCKLNESIF